MDCTDGAPLHEREGVDWVGFVRGGGRWRRTVEQKEKKRKKKKKKDSQKQYLVVITILVYYIAVYGYPEACKAYLTVNKVNSMQFNWPICVFTTASKDWGLLSDYLYPYTPPEHRYSSRN